MLGYGGAAGGRRRGGTRGTGSWGRGLDKQVVGARATRRCGSGGGLKGARLRDRVQEGSGGEGLSRREMVG